MNTRMGNTGGVTRWQVHAGRGLDPRLAGHYAMCAMGEGVSRRREICRWHVGEARLGLTMLEVDG